VSKPRASAEFHSQTPNEARVLDYLLGGKDNFAGYELDTQGHLNSAVYHQYGETRGGSACGRRVTTRRHPTLKSRVLAGGAG
jgi:hypothetical protein